MGGGSPNAVWGGAPWPILQAWLTPPTPTPPNPIPFFLSNLINADLFWGRAVRRAATASSMATSRVAVSASRRRDPRADPWQRVRKGDVPRGLSRLLAAGHTTPRPSTQHAAPHYDPCPFETAIQRSKQAPTGRLQGTRHSDPAARLSLPLAQGALISGGGGKSLPEHPSRFVGT